MSGAFEPSSTCLGIGLGLGVIIVNRAAARRPDVSLRRVRRAGAGRLGGNERARVRDDLQRLLQAQLREDVRRRPATPMGISEIAIGEMLWALMRSALDAVAMFRPYARHGPRSCRRWESPWSWPRSWSPPAFAAAGLAGDLVPAHGERLRHPPGLIVTPMFLFSGTFFRSRRCPDWLVDDHQLHAALPRPSGSSAACRPGSLASSSSWTSLDLVGFFAIRLWHPMRQMERKLIK